VSAALHNGAPKPKWRFFMQALGESTSGHGGGQHWVTVSRGPAEDVTDANGEFKSTWRKPVYTDEVGLYKLNAVDPHLESTRLQPLNLSSGKLVSTKFAIDP
jgi:hypothetical protein